MATDSTDESHERIRIGPHEYVVEDAPRGWLTLDGSDPFIVVVWWFFAGLALSAARGRAPGRIWVERRTFESRWDEPRARTVWIAATASWPPTEAERAEARPLVESGELADVPPVSRRDRASRLRATQQRGWRHTLGFTVNVTAYVGTAVLALALITLGWVLVDSWLSG